MLENSTVTRLVEKVFAFMELGSPSQYSQNPATGTYLGLVQCSPYLNSVVQKKWLAFLL
jgi:hypothetical protein